MKELNIPPEEKKKIRESIDELPPLKELRTSKDIAINELEAYKKLESLSEQGIATLDSAIKIIKGINC